tara:strand:+ start:357 stop:575 length:219 start_codon:yes stop_codon:yes gene_type:complete
MGISTLRDRVCMTAAMLVLEEAKQMLETTDARTDTIAEQVGYTDLDGSLPPCTRGRYRLPGHHPPRPGRGGK